MKHYVLTFFIFFSSLFYAQSDGENSFFLAETYYREGAYEKASQLFKVLYQKNAFNTTYLTRLISCYQETEQFEEAELLLKNKLKTHKDHSYLYVLLGYNFEKQQQQKRAEQNYTKAINAIEVNANYASIIARLFKNYNLLDFAILAYKKAMQKNINANFNFQIAQIYGEQGAYKKMFTSYLNLLDKEKNYLNLVQSYTSRYLTEDADNKVNILFKKQVLQKAISNPKNEWNILLSWLFTQQKEYDKAFVQEKALFQRNNTSFTRIFNLGKIAYNSKNFDAAEECLNFIVKNTLEKEEKIEAELYVVNIAIATKKTNVAAIFSSLFAKYGITKQTIGLQIAYADYLTFVKNNPEEAKIVLQKAMSFAGSKFEKGRIKLKLADVLVFTNTFNKALIYYSQIQTQLKGNDLAQKARFKVAQTSYFKGDFEWAKAQLKVLKSATTQKIANDATDLFLKITDNEPVDSIPSGLKQYAKAELLSYQNKNEEALQLLSDLFLPNAIFKNGVSALDVIYDDVLFLKAKLLLKEGRFLEAISSLKKIIALNNESFLADDVYYLIAETYNFHLNDTEKAKEFYQKIIFDYSSSIYLIEARKKFRKLRGEHL